MMQAELSQEKKERLLMIVKNSPEDYRMNFLDWMPDNWHIIVAFFVEANRVWNSGRRHHSARDLCAHLRHETALYEAQNRVVNPKGFKINNNVSPSLARLYVAIYPERANLFEMRELKAEVEA